MAIILLILSVAYNMIYPIFEDFYHGLLWPHFNPRSGNWILLFGATVSYCRADWLEKAASDGLFASPVKSDFPVNGRSYAEISSDEWSRVRSIAMERHKAFNWLCGHAPRNNWEETPTDT
jgi:hypothetical protein